jgi:poly(hydroxyalkanoate) depolymerase family esterase
LQPVGARGETSRLSVLDGVGPNPGALRAKIYVPENFATGSALVVVLHGCTQTPDGYDRSASWSNAADEHGFALLFPEQQRANNPNLCFNWFSPEHAARDRGEALSIRQMVAEMQSRFATDPKRVFVTGLSAGGAMAAVMLASYPEVFAGGGIIAGLPFGIAHSVPEAFERMRGQGSRSSKALAELVRSASFHRGPWPTLSVWHGTEDDIVDPSNAGDLVDQWRTLHDVSEAPCRTDQVEGYPHRVWCDPAGREVVEEYLITGLTHGVPLDTAQPQFQEVAGPYMVDAGISSTRHLLRFWQLTPEVSARAGGPSVAAHGGTGASPVRDHSEPRDATGHVTRTIEAALRRAGLMH